MKEKTLLKISLIVGMLGLILLYFFSSGISVDVVDSIDEIPAEEEVKIRGVVGKVTDGEKVIFLEILNEKVVTTKVVLFKDGEIELSEGDYVEITGTVEDYLGEKEVIGNKIEKK